MHRPRGGPRTRRATPPLRPARLPLLLGAAAPSVLAVAPPPPEVAFFDMDAAVRAEGLAYEEQLVGFVFEGLANRARDAAPRLMLNAGYMNFDWPGADMYWRRWLTEQGRVRFRNVMDATLCGLVTHESLRGAVKGVALYETLAAEQQEEWTLPIATTVASQQQLLPVTRAVLARHACLAALPVIADLTKLPEMADRGEAWQWAFAHLLPHASRRVAYNLYHYAPETHSDPQSNATLANVDWAVQQGAFVMNFRTPGNPASEVSPLFATALAGMDPLFSAYGWTDDEFGFVWMTQSSGASPNGTRGDAAAGGGGAVFCSFATPNLSFWKLLALPDGRTKARPLPVFDRGMPLDRTKSYVLLETNEGDTPRIVVSAFSQAWTDPDRGSVPVSWAIDPQLGDEFPALFDYFSATAGANDSFISGPGGCGYVYLGNMSGRQLRGFAARCGRLMREYGPAVLDTFGQQGTTQAASRRVLADFSRYAAEGGVAPQMYITQPTKNIRYAYLPCNESEVDRWQPDGTPVLCTHEGLFYVMSSLGGKELARRINAVAASHKPPYFITVYGGLRWTTTTGKTSVFSFWRDAIANLDSNVVPVGAQEMVRLAAEAAGEARAEEALLV